MLKENKVHSRCKIRLDTVKSVEKFVSKLNSDGTIDKYFLEDFNGDKRVDARSYLGVVYASSDFSGEIYLVNATNDGKYPSFISEFMIF